MKQNEYNLLKNLLITRKEEITDFIKASEKEAQLSEQRETNFRAQASEFYKDDLESKRAKDKLTRDADSQRFHYAFKNGLVDGLKHALFEIEILEKALDAKFTVENEQ